MGICLLAAKACEKSAEGEVVQTNTQASQLGGVSAPAVSVTAS